MRADGRRNQEIAERFHISAARVGQIIRKEDEQVLSDERAEHVRRRIRAGNDLRDLDEKLPVGDIFCLLQLPPLVVKRFEVSFQHRGILTLSLREFMDILIPLVDAPRNFYDALPAFKIRNIGRKSYAAVVMKLSSLDLGEAFSKEWAERRRRLSLYLLASEGYDRSKSLLYQFCGYWG
jgi:hypothetical protein